MKTNQVSSYVGLQYVQRTTVCTDIVNRQTKCIVYSMARHSVLSEDTKGAWIRQAPTYDLEFCCICKNINNHKSLRCVYGWSWSDNLWTSIEVGHFPIIISPVLH